MYIKRSGFSSAEIVLLIVAVLAAASIGIYYYLKPASPAAPTGNATSTISNTGDDQTTTATSTVTTGSSTSTPSSTVANGFWLSPTSGLVGATVTIHGNDFAATGNKVLMDGMVSASLENLASPDDKTITFTVPSGLGPDCKPNEACPAYEMLVSARAYMVSVVSNDKTYTIGTFTVTGGGTHLPM